MLAVPQVLDIFLHLSSIVHLLEFELQEHLFHAVPTHDALQEVRLHLDFLRENLFLLLDSVRIDVLFNQWFLDVFELLFDVVIGVFEFILKPDELLQKITEISTD